MSKAFREQELKDKAKKIVDSIKSTEEKIYIRQPVKPKEPKEPKKPYMADIKKPKFFNLAEFIITVALISIPLYFILMWFLQDIFHIATLILASIIAVVSLGYQYRKAFKIYNKSKKKNEAKQNEYNDNLDKYRNEYLEYQTLLTRYQDEISVYHNEYDKRKHLRTALESYKKELAEILKFEGKSDDLKYVKVNLRLDYRDYLPDYNNQNLKQENNAYSPFETTSNPSKDYLSKAIKYLANLNYEKRSKIFHFLKEVQAVQESNSNLNEKRRKIKKIFWSDRSRDSKLLLGGLLGAAFGLTVLGTGGIGIATMGGAIGIWGWLATGAGGVFVSSLIQNFEKTK